MGKKSLTFSLGAVLLLLVAAATLQSCMEPGQATPVGLPASPAPAKGPALTVYIDDTKSTAPEIRQRGVEALSNHLPELLKGGDYGSVKVAHFGDAGWFSKADEFPLPAAVKTPCGEPAAKSGGVFKPLNVQERHEREEGCKRVRENAERTYQSELDGQLARVRESLAKPVHDDAPCTAFGDALASIAGKSSPGVTIILSDAMETCGKQIVRPPEPGAGTTVVLFLLPSKYDMGENRSAYREFSKRKEALMSIAPWLRVEPPDRIEQMDSKGAVGSGL
jgi:hypothetical protein